MYKKIIIVILAINHVNAYPKQDRSLIEIQLENMHAQKYDEEDTTPESEHFITLSDSTKTFALGAAAALAAVGIATYVQSKHQKTNAPSLEIANTNPLESALKKLTPQEQEAINNQALMPFLIAQKLYEEATKKAKLDLQLEALKANAKTLELQNKPSTASSVAIPKNSQALIVQQQRLTRPSLSKHFASCRDFLNDPSCQDMELKDYEHIADAINNSAWMQNTKKAAHNVLVNSGAIAITSVANILVPAGIKYGVETAIHLCNFDNKPYEASPIALRNLRKAILKIEHIDELEIIEEEFFEGKKMPLETEYLFREIFNQKRRNLEHSN